MTPEQEIYENSVRVIEGCAPLSGLGSRFGYNRESVEWLDGYIDRLHDGGQFKEEEQLKNLTINFGCFLGECIRAAYGGAWREHDLAWGVFFEDQAVPSPSARSASNWRMAQLGVIRSCTSTICCPASSRASWRRKPSQIRRNGRLL